MAKIEQLNKAELVEYCKNIGLKTDGKKKDVLLKEAQEYGNNEIKQAIKAGKGYDLLTEKIKILAESFTILKEDKPLKLKEY
jgi:type II restriction enzyme